MSHLHRLPLLATLVALAVPGPAPAAAQESPYVEHRAREVKALSSEEIDDLLSGRGMGLALAAELNGYPGPKHVLELAGELDLTEEQLAATRGIFARMEASAIELGREIVARERRLDELFAAREIDPETLATEVERLGELNGRLRAVHLAAHLDTTDLLTPAQRESYFRARGYEDGEAHDPSRHHG